MKSLRISDSYYNKSNMVYIHDNLSGLISKTGTAVTAECDDKRAILNFKVDDTYTSFLKSEIEDKIADVIAVNYKYSFLKKKVNPIGLKGFERELLLTALISADIEDDKKYIINKICKYDDYSIDGTFNFRMIPLKEKWQEIAGYIPTYFQGEELRDFIIYIVSEKKGKRVFVENDKVYDRHFNRLRRCFLTDGNFVDGYVIREILLSGSGEVELSGKLSGRDEYYLKQYYGDRIFFRKGYFS